MPSLHNTHTHIATVVINSILAAHFKFVLENSIYFIAGGRLKKKVKYAILGDNGQNIMLV